MITIQRKLGKCSASQHLKLELLNPHFFGAQRLRSSCVLLGPRSLKVSGTWTGGLKWVPFGHDGQRTSGAPVGTWIECACLVLNQSESSNFRGQTGSAYIIAEECPTGRKMDSSPLEEHHLLLLRESAGKVAGAGCSRTHLVHLVCRLQARKWISLLEGP